MIRYIPSPITALEIPSNRWLATVHDLALWIELCDSKTSKLYKSHPCHDRIFACSSISRSIIHTLSEKLIDPPSYLHLAVSKHDFFGVQAVMLFTEFDSIISISYLATHPNNIYMTAEEKKSNTAIKGSGTSLIHFIKNYANMKSLNKISVGALPCSITFYQKFGFQKDEKTEESSASVITVMHLFLDRVTNSKAVA